MRKQLSIHIAFMIAGLAAASVLALYLQHQQQRINPDRNALNSSPLAGNHKVIADWEWMRFINYLGQLQVVDETNVKEVTERLERLIGLDPKFERLYLDGLSFIRHADPKKTVKLLENACKLEYLKNNWKIPFYTGFIYSRDTYDIHDQDGAPLLAADHAKAAEFFKMAIVRSAPNTEPFLFNNYIREQAKAEAAGTAPDRENYAKLKLLYREWKKFKTAQSPFPRQNDEDFMIIPDLPERLLKAIQEAKNPKDIYDQKFEPGKETLEIIAVIRKEVFADRVLCPDCLYPIAPGNRFCTHCGHRFKDVLGICGKCGVTLKDGAKFCPECGTPVQQPEQASSAAKKTEQAK